MEKISDEEIDNVIKHIAYLEEVEPGRKIKIERQDLFRILQELKERREADEKALAIKDQLRMVRDKCPDIWDIIHNNWYSIFGFSLCHKFKYKIFKEGKE